MPRPSPYTDEQKSAILDAVKSGRKSGKKWPEIHAAATEVGYKGGVQYLMKMARESGVVRRKRKANNARPATAVKGKGKRDKPNGSKNAPKRGVGRPKMASGVGSDEGLRDIDKIVAAMVEQRVASAIARAVASLEQAVNELRKL